MTPKLLRINIRTELRLVKSAFWWVSWDVHHTALNAAVQKLRVWFPTSIYTFKVAPAWRLHLLLCDPRTPIASQSLLLLLTMLSYKLNYLRTHRSILTGAVLWLSMSYWWRSLFEKYAQHWVWQLFDELRSDHYCWWTALTFNPRQGNLFVACVPGMTTSYTFSTRLFQIVWFCHNL